MDLSPEAWAFLGVCVVQGATLGGIAIRYGRQAGPTDTDALRTTVREAVDASLKEVKDDLKEVRRDVRTHLRDHAVHLVDVMPHQRSG